MIGPFFPLSCAQFFPTFFLPCAQFFPAPNSSLCPILSPAQLCTLCMYLHLFVPREKLCVAVKIWWHLLMDLSGNSHVTLHSQQGVDRPTLTTPLPPPLLVHSPQVHLATATWSHDFLHWPIRGHLPLYPFTPCLFLPISPGKTGSARRTPSPSESAYLRAPPLPSGHSLPQSWDNLPRRRTPVIPPPCTPPSSSAPCCWLIDTECLRQYSVTSAPAHLSTVCSSKELANSPVQSAQRCLRCSHSLYHSLSCTTARCSHCCFPAKAGWFTAAPRCLFAALRSPADPSTEYPALFALFSLSVPQLELFPQLAVSVLLF